MMKLYHYSEDPAIAVFHPHIAKTSRVRHEAYVWAIDEWHSPMYYLPRDWTPWSRISTFGAVLARRVGAVQPLDLGHAAIDEQLDAGDVAAVVRGEEHGGFRHLVRPAHPAQRHGSGEAHLELIDSLLRQTGLVEDGRFGVSGADGVDADLAVPQVGGPAARERPHGRLRRAVDADRFQPFGRNDRGVQDDRPAVREERQGLLDREEQSLDVDVEHLVEVLLGDFSERG